MCRLGDNLVIQISGIHRAVESWQTEKHWLLRIAPHFPVPSPIPAECFG